VGSSPSSNDNVVPLELSQVQKSTEVVNISCDVDHKAAYADNAVLPPHFLRALHHCFPKGSAQRTEVELSMKKNYTLNWFHSIFVGMVGWLRLQGLKMVSTVETVREGTGKPYWGRIDYESDDGLLSDD
jgi:hypothetical protein